MEIYKAKKYIKLSQKVLSFYKKVIDAQRLLFYIISSNYVFCSII